MATNVSRHAVNRIGVILAAIVLGVALILALAIASLYARPGAFLILIPGVVFAAVVYIATAAIARWRAEA